MVKKREIESNVSEYLINSGEEGVKHGDKIITIENKNVKKRHKKVEKEKKAVDFLSGMGFKNPSQFYKRYNEALENETEEKTTIKIKEKKK